MCGRYTLTKLADLTNLFPWASNPPEMATARYNIAPSQPLLAVANDHPDRYAHFIWGLVPTWAKDPAIGNRMINARAEGIADKPAFRAAYRRRRCLLPADGFYEWQTVAGSKSKRPMHITMKDRTPFAFAGLWEVWRDDAGNELPTCTVITTAPNALMQEIHNRMPVILPREHFDRWLDPKEQSPDVLDPLLAPYPAEQMQAIEVSRRVNNPKSDTAECLAPPDRPAGADLSKGLFD